MEDLFGNPIHENPDKKRKPHTRCTHVSKFGVTCWGNLTSDEGRERGLCEDHLRQYHVRAAKSAFYRGKR